jgi:hypothetical protein
MNSDGSIAEESVYNNTLAEAEIFAYSIVKKYGKCIAVCESTANLWLKQNCTRLFLIMKYIQGRDSFFCAPNSTLQMP